MFTQNKNLGERPFGLSLRAGKEVKRQSDRVRYDPVVKRDQGLPAGFNGQSFNIMDAVVTTQITASNGATFGTGMVQLYFYNSSISTTVLQADPTGQDGSGNTPVINAVYPGYTNVGTWVKVCLTGAGWSLLPPPVPAPGIPSLYCNSGGGIPAATGGPAFATLNPGSAILGPMCAMNTYGTSPNSNPNGVYEVISPTQTSLVYNFYSTAVASNIWINVAFNYERAFTSGFGSFSYVSRA
jgi:hypothetical protein